MDGFGQLVRKYWLREVKDNKSGDTITIERRQQSASSHEVLKSNHIWLDLLSPYLIIEISLDTLKKWLVTLWEYRARMRQLTW
jgi:hypothetical protein